MCILRISNFLTKSGYGYSCSSGKTRPSCHFRSSRIFNALDHGPRTLKWPARGTTRLISTSHITSGAWRRSTRTRIFISSQTNTGFDPLVAHLKQERIFADRVAKVADIPALIQTSVISKTPAEKVAFAKERLLKSNATRPRTRKTLTSHVAAMFLKALAAEDVETIVEGLFRDGCTIENGKRITYSDEAL